MAERRILIIDDEVEIREFFCDFLEERDFSCDVARDGLHGFEMYQKGQYDLVICDMMMPGMVGIEVLEKIKEIKADQKVLMLTGVREASLVKRAEELGCSFYLNKPVGLDELEEKINECFE